ncbi:putative phycoerythrobilin:Cys-84 alpha R-phycocyanin II lyase/ RpcF subunit [Synechococcus sp. BOUM118]|mgnify:FL=1|jgi:phycocyanobilin lyase beta subunit|nr:putative phycoerythrobilin:Cys-84 alpha R-phycocyanin II lyase/ RpcF subunit [Synechococcus sp. BOUM118]|tara:strand:- start:89 stop:721 length:633 start_codon:yes stop_codon:yes gene_type:complete
MTSTALADAIRHLDQASSTPELVQATRALCALQDPEAADTLINVLGFNNPAVAAVATQGLIQLGRNIVPTLLVSLDARNYGARAWVVKALAALRDPRGLDLLEHALEADIAPSVRRSATRGLADLELDPACSDQQLQRCLQGLLKAGQDDEWVVRYAAVFGLEQRLRHASVGSSLTDQAVPMLRTLASEAEDARVVRLRAELALQRLNIE